MLTLPSASLRLSLALREKKCLGQFLSCSQKIPNLWKMLISYALLMSSLREVDMLNAFPVALNWTLLP